MAVAKAFPSEIEELPDAVSSLNDVLRGIGQLPDDAARHPKVRHDDKSANIAHVVMGARKIGDKLQKVLNSAPAQGWQPEEKAQLRAAFAVVKEKLFSEPETIETEVETQPDEDLAPTKNKPAPSPAADDIEERASALVAQASSAVREMVTKSPVEKWTEPKRRQWAQLLEYLAVIHADCE